VEREKAHHAITLLCRVLAVSVSGYYAWRKREPSVRTREDAVLTEHIRAIHEQSRQTYGAPRVHAELVEAGIRCGKKRVARLMHTAGIVGCHRRRHVVTTVREPASPVAPDRLERQFVAEAPDTKWTADITYVPTWSGFLYLAVVLDVFSRRIVGWAMADHLRTELVLSALDMAIHNRRPDPGVIHHSDHGCPYTSIAFGSRCEDAGVVPSLGTPSIPSRRTRATPSTHTTSPPANRGPLRQSAWACSPTIASIIRSCKVRSSSSAESAFMPPQPRWPSAQHIGHRLVSGTLRCRQCGRDAGDLVGHADASVTEARSGPPTSGFMPYPFGSRLICSPCDGQLFLDDVETLGRHVPHDDVCGPTLAHVLTGVDVSSDGAVALP